YFRPGRPPGRASLVGLSGVGATSPASGGHGGHQASGGHPGAIQGGQPGPFPQGLLGGHKGPQGPMGVGGPFGQTTHDGLDGNGTGTGAFEFRRESRGDDEINGVVGRNGQSGQPGDRGQSPLEHHHTIGPGSAGGLNRNSSHSEQGGNHLKQESRSDEETPGGAGSGLSAMGADAEGMNAMQAMLFKAMWSQGGGQGDPKGAPPFPPALVANMAAVQLPGQPPMNTAMAAAMASQMDLMLGLQHNPQIAAAAAAAYQRQLLQAASLAQQQMKSGQQSKEHGLVSGMHPDQRNRSRSPENASKKEFRSRESESPAAAAGHPRSEHHQSRKSSFESSKKMHNNNSISSSLNSSAITSSGPGLDSAVNNALNLSSGGKDVSVTDRKKRSRSVSSDEGSLSDGPLSELSANNLDNNDDTSNYGDDDDLDKTGGRSPKRTSDRDEALSTSSRESERRRSHGGGSSGGLGALGVLGLERLARGEARDSRDSNHSVPTPIALMQQHLSVDRTPPSGSPTPASHLTNSTPGSRSQHHHIGGGGVQTNTNAPATGSIEALLQNILGLLKVAEENARAQEQQMHLEKAELKVEILRERSIREQLEKQLQEEQHRRLFYQKKLRREKRCRRQMQEQLDGSAKRPRLSACSDVDEEKEDTKEEELETVVRPQEIGSIVGSGGEEPISAQTAPTGATTVPNGLLPNDTILALETPASASDGLSR
ncbi:hypothetical protein BIW11_08427, partial [Tropilaelaps mercedesae]